MPTIEQFKYAKQSAGSWVRYIYFLHANQFEKQKKIEFI